MKSIYQFRMKSITVIILLGVLLLTIQCGNQSRIVISVVNPLSIERRDAIVSVSFDLIQERIQRPIKHLHVLDMSGKHIVSQLIDEDEDGLPEKLLFHTDFGPKMERLFRLKTNDKVADGSKSFVHASFVPEGMEDFNWENDRIGYRFYGRARMVEGVSSGIDVWCKRVPYRMIEKWYDPQINYHEDLGEGADHYGVKAMRGCGGTAVWHKGQMVPAEPYIEWRIVEEGPIRTVFELIFPEIDVMGDRISQVKRVSLDAGHYLNHIEMMYRSENRERVPFVIGISNHKGSIGFFYEEEGFLQTWESLGEGKGELGCAIFLEDVAEHLNYIKDKNHYLIVSETETGKPFIYYAGACWSEYGDIRNEEDWGEYIRQWIQMSKNPLIVKFER